LNYVCDFDHIPECRAQINWTSILSFDWPASASPRRAFSDSRHAAHFPERERSGVGLVAPQSRVITTPTIITLACVAGHVTDE
jgi:hypothetical protein